MSLRLTIEPCQGKGRITENRNNLNNLNLIPTQFLGTLLGQKRTFFNTN